MCHSDINVMAGAGRGCVDSNGTHLARNELPIRGCRRSAKSFCACFQTYTVPFNFHLDDSLGPCIGNSICLSVASFAGRFAFAFILAQVTIV